MENYQQTQEQPYVSNAPVAQLKTNRGLLKTILLSLITFGIYGVAVYAGIGNDTNIVCSRYDGKKTMSYWLMFFLITPITLGIGLLVWTHKLYNRIGNELKRRQIDYSLSAGTFWGWTILGSLIIVGPFVATHKLMVASNKINADFNVKG